MPRSEPAEKRDLPTVVFASRTAWQAWLAKHHVTSRGVWLKIGKKDTAGSTVSYVDALNAALSYGARRIEQYVAMLSERKKIHP